MDPVGGHRDKCMALTGQTTRAGQQLLAKHKLGLTALPAASSPNNHDGVGRKGIAPQLQACQAHVLGATAQVACHGLQELPLFSASSGQCTRQVTLVCMQEGPGQHCTRCVGVGSSWAALEREESIGPGKQQ